MTVHWTTMRNHLKRRGINEWLECKERQSPEGLLLNNNRRLTVTCQPVDQTTKEKGLRCKVRDSMQNIRTSRRSEGHAFRRAQSGGSVSKPSVVVTLLCDDRDAVRSQPRAYFIPFKFIDHQIIKISLKPPSIPRIIVHWGRFDVHLTFHRTISVM